MTNTKPPKKMPRDLELMGDYIDGLLSDPESNAKSKTQSQVASPYEALSGNQPANQRDNDTRLPAQSSSVEVREPRPVKDSADDRLVKVEQLLSRMPISAAPKKQENTSAESITKVEQEAAPVTEPTTKVALAENEPKLDAHKVQTPATAQASLSERDVSRAVEPARQALGDSFQTLLFDIGQLTLAVPLIKLGGIHAISASDVTPLFGSPEWFMGLVPQAEGENLQLVDTARYIMPEKYPQIADDLNYRYAICLDDTPWALACTQVREAKTLHQDDVRWAQPNSQKKWFAGMVVEHMCALLEVDALINMLHQQGKQQKSS